jgi:hypothetical protein
MRAGISSERSSRRKSGILILPGTGRGTAARSAVVEGVGRSCNDRFGDTVRVLEHACRRYPQYSIAPLSKEGVPPLISLRSVTSIMGLAVHLDNELRTAAVEVDNVTIDRMLLAEAYPTRGAAETLPQQHFRQAHGTPKLSGGVDDRPAQIAPAPSTTGLPPAVPLPVPGRI